MHPSDSRLLSNLAAALLLAAAALFVLARFGFDLGVQRWLACQFTTIGMDNGLLQLGMVIAVGLLIIPATRMTGVGLLILGVGGAYALELLRDAAQAGCYTAGAVP
jgi:hypothetical protein